VSGEKTRGVEILQFIGDAILIVFEIAARVRRPLYSLGRCDLRGVAGTQEVFTLKQGA
jgi:class 3 adenylate cyclase